MIRNGDNGSRFFPALGSRHGKDHGTRTLAVANTVSAVVGNRYLTWIAGRIYRYRSIADGAQNAKELTTTDSAVIFNRQVGIIGHGVYFTRYIYLVFRLYG
ncbi:hypothetical protein [Flavisolibacter tropicus]|uniref:hypothetical protein n=1 Tax=Flavisolibacter tropicus TaxID=1492898 RepID=UPI003AB07E76